VTGFVPRLDRLAVREISGRFLSQDERIEIADLRHAELSIRQIAYQCCACLRTCSPCSPAGNQDFPAPWHGLR
jgi:hypothetical protein